MMGYRPPQYRRGLKQFTEIEYNDNSEIQLFIELLESL